MDHGMLSLRWENHRIAFLEAFASLRKKDTYCDATIACDGKFFSVHKLVLSTCSDYLAHMFEKANKFSNTTHPVIVLQNVKHKILECLLDYMYVGEVNVLQSELSTLIKAAECLQIKGLAVHDEYPSGQNLDTNNESNKISNVSKKHQNYKEKFREKTTEREPENISDSRNRPNEQYVTNARPSNSSYEKDIHNSESNTASRSRKSPEICSKLTSENSELIDNNVMGKMEPIDIETNQDNLQIKEEPQKEIVNDEDYDAREYLEENFNSYDPSYIPDRSSFINHMQQNVQSTSSNNVQRTPHVIYPFDLSTRNQELSGSIDVNDVWNKSYKDDSTGRIDVNEVWNKAYKDESTGVACPICQKVYYLKGSFIYHYKTHTSERSFVCPLCSRCFIQKSTLDRHIKSHTGEKPFACRLCPRRFIQKSDLRNHILTHTGEKPFSCPNCMQAFARKTLLNYHMINCQPIEQNLQQIIAGGEANLHQVVGHTNLNLSQLSGSDAKNNEQNTAMQNRDSNMQQPMELETNN
ncbi:unnamed protein product [Meganyctiphanes norvegica]|uniref:Uncharacterized protein n=1 Tax=Meganyctiphanes norvegica TaxID=48144 RepID=A0AAV2S9C7_MEGNR